MVREKLSYHPLCDGWGLKITLLEFVPFFNVVSIMELLHYINTTIRYQTNLMGEIYLFYWVVVGSVCVLCGFFRNTMSF